VSSVPTTRSDSSKQPLSDTRRRAHLMHALGMLIVPPLGSIAAVVWLLQVGAGLTAVLTLTLLYALSGAGMTVGFHRLLAHRAFEAGPGLRACLVICGCLTGQGPPFYWVANHRRHHKFSDRPGDPHSPYWEGSTSLRGVRGFWHSHAGWTLSHELTDTLAYCRDLFRDPIVRAINKHYLRWFALGLVFPAAVGGALEGFPGAVSGFLWGGLVRLFLVYHVTLAINSVTHLIGSRPFATREQSRNCALLAVPSLGESWHNNHHAFPSSAQFGLVRGQIDLGGVLIRVLEHLGLARHVKRPSAEAIIRGKGTVQ
jgi:stearoyl-CoA desaturase (delta-9 desaturase)